MIDILGLLDHVATVVALRKRTFGTVSGRLVVIVDRLRRATLAVRRGIPFKSFSGVALRLARRTRGGPWATVGVALCQRPRREHQHRWYEQHQKRFHGWQRPVALRITD